MTMHLMSFNLNHFRRRKQGLFLSLIHFIERRNCQLPLAGVACNQHSERVRAGMKKVAIVGLGWLGMPLALSLTARGWQVTGSKLRRMAWRRRGCAGSTAIRCAGAAAGL